jgi:hypothetical protein
LRPRPRTASSELILGSLEHGESLRGHIVNLMREVEASV